MHEIAIAERVAVVQTDGSDANWVDMDSDKGIGACELDVLACAINCLNVVCKQRNFK